MIELPPWLQPAWDRLEAQVRGDRLPHALLVTGPEQSGKTTFATEFAASLLCSGGGQAPCGSCRQCLLVAAGTHPDLLVVTLEIIKDRESKQIRVEQVRDLIEWAMQTAQQGGRKVCLIDPADRMNIQASNALLKCLEEPPADTVICLVTANPARLLPTLRSRCQRVECGLPSRSEAVNWLRNNSQVSMDADLLIEVAGGVPLRAVSQVDEEYLKLRATIASHLMPLVEGRGSPLGLAATLSKSDPDAVLEIFYQLVADSITVTCGGSDSARNTDLKDILERFAGRVPLRTRYQLLDRIVEARGLVAGTTNANLQMLLEWVLLRIA